MELTLEVTAVSGHPPKTPLRLRICEGTRLLGRNPDNDLVLEDPERTVSGLHARIEAAGNSFTLIDLSTNGTYLNDAPDPLPRNQPTPLQDGDQLVIGPYDISVAIAAPEWPDAATSPAPELVPPAVPGFATQLHEPKSEMAPRESVSSTEPPRGRAPRATEDDLPGLEQAAAGEDILDLLGGGDQPGDGKLLEQAADPFAEPPGVQDLLADADVGPGAAPPPTPMEQVFYQPAPSEQIPEDYDLLGDDGPAARTAAPVDVGSAVQPLTAPPSTPTPDRSIAEATPTEPTPPPAPAAASASTEPEAARSESQAAAEGAVQGAPHAAAPTPRPASGRRERPAEAPTADIDRAPLNAFLAGLGVGEPAQIPDPEAFLRRAGALLRTMVGGLSTTLLARTHFKSEMRLGVTTIRRSENNPLKFSVSVEDALERLLLRETRGFLPAQEAVKQGFEDIQAHEMAMIAGLRSALEELLGRFAPATLEAELTAKSLDKVLPMVRKSRCWELLTERHAQISADAAEDFMKVFGESFSRAYDEQVALLAQARQQRER